MSDDRSQTMLDILLGIQKDLGLIEREQVSQGIGFASLDERRLGLIDTEH